MKPILTALFVMISLTACHSGSDFDYYQPAPRVQVETPYYNSHRHQAREPHIQHNENERIYRREQTSSHHGQSERAVTENRVFHGSHSQAPENTNSHGINQSNNHTYDQNQVHGHD